MKREIIRVEPLATYLEKYKAPVSTVTKHGDTIYVSQALQRSTRKPERLSEGLLDPPDRDRFRPAQALCRNGGFVLGKHPETECLRDFSRYVSCC